MEFWSKLGTKLRLADAADAERRAADSDGTHFSFCNDDLVTRTTVRGRVPMSMVSEQQTHRGQLISFALPTDVLDEAQMVCHSSKAATVESDESDEGGNEADGDAGVQAQAARQAVLAASAARYAKLANRGKRNPVAQGEAKPKAKRVKKQ